jgi:kexin
MAASHVSGPELALTCNARGESGVGSWTVVVKDSDLNEHQGTWIDWHLKLWGEAIDPDKATKLPMPHEDDDNDHALLATTTISAATTSLTHATESGLPAGNPTDHIDRPAKIKPTSTTRTDEVPSGSAAPGEGGGGTSEGQVAESSSSNWISWLPSFGMSTGVQMWIYGSLGLIIVFCCALGVYFWLARRRRLRNNPRGEYEFEMLRDEETEALGAGEKGAVGGRRGRRTRGGELYDAFAGGSDDEDFDVTGYRDDGGRRSESDDDEGHHVVGDDDEEEEGVEAENPETGLLGDSSRR